jgi:hypothetical protein
MLMIEALAYVAFLVLLLGCLRYVINSLDI